MADSQSMLRRRTAHPTSASLRSSLLLFVSADVRAADYVVVAFEGRGSVWYRGWLVRFKASADIFIQWQFHLFYSSLN